MGWPDQTFNPFLPGMNLLNVHPLDNVENLICLKNTILGITSDLTHDASMVKFCQVVINRYGQHLRIIPAYWNEMFLVRSVKLNIPYLHFGPKV